MNSTYSTGQAVEIQTPDFKAPGMPMVWTAGVVEQVSVMDEAKRLVNVTVRLMGGGIKVETVGPRGGNKRIRAAA